MCFLRLIGSNYLLIYLFIYLFSYSIQLVDQYRDELRDFSSASLKKCELQAISLRGGDLHN